MSSQTVFPVRTRQKTVTIGGSDAHFLLSGYADRVLIVVTQVSSLGTMILVEKETVLGGGTTFRVETLMGKRDDPLLELCARQLGERIAEVGCELPLVVCLGLKPSDNSSKSGLEAIKQIVQTVLDNPVW